MRFTVHVDDILKQLQMLAGVINSNNTLAILDNILFDIGDEELTLSASDLETTIITKVSATIKEKGKVAIPAKLLIDTLKTFPNIPLTFLIDADNFGVEISSDYGKYKIAGINGIEFPKTPEKESTNNFELPSNVLANGINKCIFATGNDELRPVMSGVFVQINDESTTFAATDAHKLVRYRRTDFTSDLSTSFILPKKPLNLLKNLLSGSDEEVKIEYNPSHAFFSFGKINLVCRLIDGKYPNYEAVIPKENPNKLTVNRQEFLTSIRRISIFANKSTHQIRLKVAGSSLTISAQDIDFANEAAEQMPCEFEGTDIEIGFNSRFLMEMLNNIQTDKVDLKMSAPNKAGILLPADNENPAEDLLMLVMPLMIKND